MMQQQSNGTSSPFPYKSAKDFVTAVQLAMAPDTGGALGDATVLIRTLGSRHPDWIEAACLDLVHSSHRGIRLALVDSLLYIADHDQDLAERLLVILARDESEQVRERVERPTNNLLGGYNSTKGVEIASIKDQAT